MSKQTEDETDRYSSLRTDSSMSRHQGEKYFAGNEEKEETAGGVFSPHFNRAGTPDVYGSNGSRYDNHFDNMDDRRQDRYIRDWDKETKKDPKTLKGQFIRFAENTSLMGVPFLNRATRWYAKLFWVIILLAAFICMGYQVYNIFGSYYRRETTSSVTIGFDFIDFPSVTICNMNPIRNSSRNQNLLSDELEEFFDLISPIEEYYSDTPAQSPSPNGRRRKRQVGAGGGKEAGEDGGGRRGGSGGEAPQTGDGAGDGAVGPDATKSPDKTIAPSAGPSGPKLSTGSPGPGPTPRPFNPGTSGSKPPGPPGPLNPGTSGSKPTGPSGPLSPGDLPPDRRRKPGGSIRGDPLGTKFQTAEERFAQAEMEREDNADRFGGGAISEDSKVAQVFRDLSTAMPRTNRMTVGHQPQTFILSCTFNGLQCSYENFTQSISPDYGNCYTFNDVRDNKRDTVLQSRKNGAEYGLQLILYLEEQEYINGLTNGIGARMSIHPYNTMSFVHANGHSLAPGYQTYLGMKMVNITRLGDPYDSCGDNGTFYNHYGKTYTHDACLETCVDRTIAKMCRCYRQEFAEFYTKEELKQLTRCDNKTKDGNCMVKMMRRFERGSITCGCAQACNATQYQTYYSVNRWPKTAFWHSLTEAACDSADLEEDAVLHDGCSVLMNTPVQERSEVLEKNFIKVIVYYDDLNFNEVKQQPAYEQAQFLSDFGGTIGLWVGASFITAVELFDLVAQLCCYCCRRKKQEDRRRSMTRRTLSSSSESSRRDLSDGRSTESGNSRTSYRRDTEWPRLKQPAKFGIDPGKDWLARRF